MGVLPQANLDGHLRDRVFQDVPCTVIWRGAHTAVRSTPDFTQTLIIGGVEEVVAMNLFFRKNEIPQTPVVGEIMMIEGDSLKYRVVGVRVSPDGNLITCAMAFSRER